MAYKIAFLVPNFGQLRANVRAQQSSSPDPFEARVHQSMFGFKRIASTDHLMSDYRGIVQPGKFTLHHSVGPIKKTANMSLQLKSDLLLKHFTLHLNNLSSEPLYCHYVVVYGGIQAIEYRQVRLDSNKAHVGCSLRHHQIDEYMQKVDRLEITVHLVLLKPPKGSSTIKEDLLHQYCGDLQFTDAVLVANDNVELPCHKFILASRSDVFATMFAFENSTEALSGKVVMADVTSDAAQALLKYMYTDCIDAMSAQNECLLAAADKYNMVKLKSVCESALVGKISVANAVDLFQLAALHHCNTLRNRAAKFIVANWKHTRQTEAWKDMKNNGLMLEELLDLAIINSSKNVKQDDDDDDDDHDNVVACGRSRNEAADCSKNIQVWGKDENYVDPAEAAAILAKFTGDLRRPGKIDYSFIYKHS